MSEIYFNIRAQCLLFIYFVLTFFRCTSFQFYDATKINCTKQVAQTKLQSWLWLRCCQYRQTLGKTALLHLLVYYKFSCWIEAASQTCLLKLLYLKIPHLCCTVKSKYLNLVEQFLLLLGNKQFFLVLNKYEPQAWTILG